MLDLISGPQAAGAQEADLALVLAADISYSIGRAREDYLRQLDELTHGRSERWRPRQEDWPEPD